MKLKVIHHLATTENDYPLEEVVITSVHKIQDEEVQHQCLSLIGDYAGDVERLQKHRMELQVPVESLDEFFDRLWALRSRFAEEGKLPPRKDPWEQEEE